MISPEQYDSRARGDCCGRKTSFRAARMFVRVECADDAEVRDEVESLIEFHGFAGTAMDTPLAEMFGAEDRLPHPALSPGFLVKGRYRIQELLARSGFATVYLAR